MLSILRHKGVSKKILWVVTTIIILSFGFFGVASRMDHTVNSAGKIYGQSISLRDFEKAYLDARDQAILTYGDRFFKMGSMIDLEREAWNRIILLREAKKRHIKASDKEVVDFIASFPFFQSQGKFDQYIYTNVVKNQSVFSRTPKAFEEGVRGSLTIKKLFDMAAPDAIISDEELKKDYVRRNEKIQLTYVVFSPDDFKKGQTPSADDARKFYETNKESFRQPAMVNLQYVHLMYPAKATDEQKKAVKKTAEEISKELLPSSDFAAVAKKHGQDAKESGLFSQAQPLLTFAWSPEFVDKIFGLNTGEVSPPVETPDGVQIVKVKVKTESAVPEYEAVKAKAMEALLLNNGLQLAKTKAEDTLKVISEAAKTKDFAAIAAGLGLKTHETSSFARGEYINAPGLVAEFQQESLKLNETNKLSGIVPTSEGPAIAYLSKIEPVDDKKFAEEKEDYRQMMAAQKRNQGIMEFITKLKLEANLQSTLKDKVRYK